MIKYLREGRYLFSIDYNNISDDEILSRIYGITNYKKNDDGSYDVFQNIEFNNIDEIPLQFNNVDGDFDVYRNKNLTSLKGSPKTITGIFDASFCNLTSLKGSPEEVRNFDISGNKNLTSLKGSPKTVTGDFDARDCNITSLEGLPKYIGGDLNLSGNTLDTTEEEIRKICDIAGYIFL